MVVHLVYLDSPSGQAAFLQGGDGTLAGTSISQSVGGFAPASEASITFLAEDRQHVGGGGTTSQSLMVYVNGNLVDTVTPTSSSGFTSYTTPLIPVNGGFNTISFAGGGSAATAPAL